MSDEVALTTDSSSESACVLCWDTASWTQIKAYKQGICSRKCLALMSQSFIMAAQANKPFIHVWDISKEQMHSKITCPGNISALAVSPDGVYCAAACCESVFIWQVSTGNQLCALSRHFQPIRCLNFTDDSSYLISGADDNLVLVWSLVRLLSQARGFEDENTTPKYTWSNHSLPITSIHIGYGGRYARIVTSSLDHTCKLWELSTGHLLRSFVFDVAILSVVMDSAEYRVFAGGFDGKIYVVNLFSQAIAKSNLEEHISQSECFTGHSMQVTSLSSSLDGLLLLSGSKDCTARVWDVSSKQCLKVLHHKDCVILHLECCSTSRNSKKGLAFALVIFTISGSHTTSRVRDHAIMHGKPCGIPLIPDKLFGSVENVQIYPRFKKFDIKQPKTSLPVLGAFKRSLHDFHSQENESVPIRILHKIEREGHQFDQVQSVLRENCENDAIYDGKKDLSKSDLKEKLNESKQLNQTLYDFAVKELLSEVRDQSQLSET